MDARTVTSHLSHAPAIFSAFSRGRQALDSEYGPGTSAHVWATAVTTTEACVLMSLAPNLSLPCPITVAEAMFSLCTLMIVYLWIVVAFERLSHSAWLRQQQQEQQQLQRQEQRPPQPEQTRHAGVTVISSRGSDTRSSVVRRSVLRPSIIQVSIRRLSSRRSSIVAPVTSSVKDANAPSRKPGDDSGTEVVTALPTEESPHD